MRAKYRAVDALVLSRRQLIALAGAQGTALLLQGCGGGSGSSGGAAANTKAAPLNIVLPAGAKADSLEVFTGFSNVAGPSGPVSVTVLSDWVTMAQVLDKSSGKVMMVGMVDPKASANTLDARNVAATLLFLSVGGSQLFGTDRNALWQAVLADPATATLAPVVAARLNADPFALYNGDAQTKAALNQAFHALSAATLAAALPQSPGRAASSRLAPLAGAASSASALSRRSASRGSDSTPPPPSPAVYFSRRVSSEINARVAYPLDDAGEELLDYLVLSPTLVVEQEYSFYTRPDNEQKAKKRLGPIDVSWPTQLLTSRTWQSPLLTLQIEDPNASEEPLKLIIYTPVFGDPNPHDAYAPAVLAEEQALLPGLFKRAVVMIANTLFLEALGLGGAPFTLDQVRPETDQLEALGGSVAAALAQASQGKDLIGSVNALVSACTANAGIAQQVNQILRSVHNSQASYPAELLMNTAQLSRVMNFFGAGDDPGTFRGGMVLGCTYWPYDAGKYPVRNDAVFDQSVSLERVRYSIAPSSVTYGPGTSVTLRVTPSPRNTNSLRKYHWKLLTSGSATLTDGAGKSGVEFDSAKDIVSFQAGAGASGNQTVQVTVYNTEAGDPVLAGSASVILTPGGLTTGQVTVTITHVDQKLQGLVYPQAKTWKRQSATQTPDAAHGIDLDLSFQDKQGGESFQFLGWATQVAAGQQVSLGAFGTPPSFNMGLAAFVNGHQEIQAYHSKSGSFKITQVSGNQVTFTGSATMGADYNPDLTFDITVDGNTTLTSG